MTSVFCLKNELFQERNCFYNIWLHAFHECCFEHIQLQARYYKFRCRQIGRNQSNHWVFQLLLQGLDMSEELTFITLFYLANGFFQDLTMRFVVAIALSLYISRLGYHKKSLSFSGALAAVFVGFLTTLASYAYFLCLLTFFVTSSYFTTWNSKRKKKLEQNFSEGMSLLIVTKINTNKSILKQD